MSASVASKNLYELLGNDPPEDDTPPKAPREVVKNVTTSRKRDEKVSAPSAAAGNAARGNGRSGRGRYTGNDAAFHDREAGSDHNRTKGIDSAESPAARGGFGRGRVRQGRRDLDRHSATGKDEHEKQVAHAWGSNEGGAEWSDELAGVELALKDAADPADPNATTEGAEGDSAAAAAAAEEEEIQKTYDEYLAELAARQANLGPPTDVRRANEGTRDNKKWANAKPLDQDREQAEYFAGEARDKTRNRERKQKQLLDIDPRYVESRDIRRGSGDRSGRGARGGRPGGAGDRGRSDRGPPRGDRGENRGAPRGERSGPHNVNISDANSFPALGA